MIKDFYRVRVLEEWQGEFILSEVHINKEVYVEKWCDDSDGVTKTLIVKSSPKAIDAYLRGEITMLQLLNGDSGGVGIIAKYKVSSDYTLALLTPPTEDTLVRKQEAAESLLHLLNRDPAPTDKLRALMRVDESDLCDPSVKHDPSLRPKGYE